ncbi:MAG: MgtC/SapB family protein [Nitrospirae bacterium]|nr:MAG: MgtC/SapB family protein [Nitrospirota bacterium]
MLSPSEIVFRLLLGALFGGIIGFERQAHGRPAGFRTHLLVCTASVLIMIVSLEYYNLSAQNPEFIRIDPARIAAGAITGVGFLGAGVIIKTGLTVQGLTTAACLWMVSAIGLSTGSGLYLPATVTFLITFFALWVLRKIESGVPRLKYKVLTVVRKRGTGGGEVLALLKEMGFSTSSFDLEYDRVKDEETLHLTITYRDDSLLDLLSKKLGEDKEIRRFVLRG